MNKNKIYDLLIIVLLNIGISCFPINFFNLPTLAEISIQIALQVGIFLFLMWFNRRSNVKINIEKANSKVVPLFIPAFVLCFSNFFCLIAPENTFEFAFSLELVLKVVLSLCVAINEEIIFRAILLGNFWEKEHNLVRIILSALVFAACHLTHFFASFNPSSLVVVVYTSGIGIVLGMIYLYSKSIILCIVFHFLFNAINNNVTDCMLTLSGDYSYYLINALVGVVVGVYLFLLYLFNLRKKS